MKIFVFLLTHLLLTRYLGTILKIDNIVFNLLCMVGGVLPAVVSIIPTIMYLYTFRFFSKNFDNAPRGFNIF